MAFWGIGLGIGLWMLAVYVFPPRPSLRALVNQLQADPPSAPILTANSAGWALSVGKPFVGTLSSVGVPSKPLRDDLAVIGKGVDHHLAEKAVLALTGMLLPPLVQLVLVVADAGLGWEILLAASVLFGVSGFFCPDINVHREAERRRSTFRHALSAYLNLIRVLLAGGAGVDGALKYAGNVGKGWAFDQLRHALVTSRLTRSTPWSALRQLGVELGVQPLTELAASVSLAGTEGARVRASLAAKATALRTRELTLAESAAQAATERMSVPVVVLCAGFLIFIGFPAVANVLGGL
ncbi:type II secretion system F family protein [Lentzea sp. NBRC 105346]|uniref:type II secretion system F family protein n=1 Tax=Lentzea sp. NBRC 105346 TaxID=3032205 RepID=UPI002552D03B|nr:type II secretion system F family protein [Lentzea sp. NBRC 105346]